MYTGVYKRSKHPLNKERITTFTRLGIQPLFGDEPVFSPPPPPPRKTAGRVRLGSYH